MNFPLEKPRLWPTKLMRLLVLAGLLAGGALAGHTQELAIKGSVISSGGGTSHGSQFTLTGTIAQPAAGGKMNGGRFGLESGFWQVINLVQTPGAPKLTLLANGANITISWAEAASGFILESTPALGPAANWQPVSGVQNNTITVTAASGITFFRLRKTP